ncbi:MAG: hypothetical protein CMJ84_08330 [Planctomycetes bacterium]|nr:hypothetical protein [Planctomycetota bacterium]
MVSEPALAALLRGTDPLAASLAGIGAAAGASLALWRGRRGMRWAGGRAAEDPTGEVLGLGARLPAGRGERSLAAGELARLPGPRARGSRGAWIARAPGGGVLWLEATRPLDLDARRARSFCEQLGVLEDFPSPLADREAAHLARLGARAAGVAHDCRHLVSLARFQLAREGGEGTPLNDTLDELCSLSGEFLSGGAGEALAKVPLGPLAEGALESARRISSRADEVRCSLELEEAPTLRTRPRLLARVLRNLSLNAIESCAVGAEVSVAFEREREGARIIVADGGRGMGATELDWLRAGASGSGGTGYGSVSLLECIDALGARLSIDSLPAVGTVCAVHLPPG